MKTTITAEDAALILFGEKLDDPDFTGASEFRSGADVCEGLAAVFGFTAEDYESIAARRKRLREIAAADAELPDDTFLVCPSCGCDTFTAWSPTDTGYHGVKVRIEEGVRVEDDGGVYDSEAGDGIGATDQYSCLGSCGGVFEIEDLVVRVEQREEVKA